MVLTGLVKREITQVPVTKPCCRRAEISALLRFTDALHVVQGKVVVQARVDAPETAHRVRRQIIEVFAVPADQVILSPGRSDPQGQYLVQVVRGGDALARRAGLVDSQGRPVRGMPPRVVTGPVCDAEAVWRGAFLAAGTVRAAGRASSLTVACPGPEAALALTGAARRLSIPTRARGEQGTERVVVSSDATITALLTRLGAVTTWQAHSPRTSVRQSTSRRSNFDQANAHRVADAAATACARVERALQLLGDDAPDQLRAVARLRLEHPDASLKDLAQLSDPHITKDAVAGRLRRLLRHADARAQDLDLSTSTTEHDPHNSRDIPSLQMAPPTEPAH